MQTRRHFVAAAGVLSAVAVAGAAGAGAVYSAWWDQPHDSRTRHLSPDELAFLDALSDTIFPPGAALPLSGREAGVGRFMDGVLDGLAPFQRKMLRLSFHALDQWPRPSHGKPFRDLNPAEGAEVLAGWVSSGRPEVRGLLAGTYIFVAMAYSVHPKVSPVFAAQFRCGYGE